MIYAFFIRVKEVQGLRCFVSKLFVDFSTVDADNLGEHILLFEHLFKISVFKRSKDIRQDRLRVFTEAVPLFLESYLNYKCFSRRSKLNSYMSIFHVSCWLSMPFVVCNASL
jgi:hypothetical protein